MFDFFKYDFGYTWYIGYGLAIPLALAAAVVGLALWRDWPRWVSVIAGIVSIWAFVGLFLINIAWGINKPMELRRRGSWCLGPAACWMQGRLGSGSRRCRWRAQRRPCRTRCYSGWELTTTRPAV